MERKRRPKEFGAVVPTFSRLFSVTAFTATKVLPSSISTLAISVASPIKDLSAERFWKMEH